MAQRFNPPPSWPAPPQGWVPPPGWRPDPSWPPPPPGWQLWLEVPDEAPGSASAAGRSRVLRRTATAGAGVVGLVCVLAVAAAVASPDLGPPPDPPPSTRVDDRTPRETGDAPPVRTDVPAPDPTDAGTDVPGPVDDNTVQPKRADPTDPALYAYCDSVSTPDPRCWTSGFGNDVRSAEDFLQGPDFGPGGLKEMTAGPLGLGITKVGTTVPFVDNALTTDFSVVGLQQNGCTVRFDPQKYLGVVLDADGTVMAYLVINTVVRTREDIGYGSSLDEVRAAYGDVRTEPIPGGQVAYTEPVDDPEPLIDDPERSMMFVLDGAGRVTEWRVGVHSYVSRPQFCP